MSPLAVVLLIVLVCILFGGFTPIRGGNFYGGGPYLGGGVGLVLVIIVILAVLGRL